MKKIFILTAIFFIYDFTNAQGYKDYEIGVEITGASGNDFGGLIGGVLKFAMVEEKMDNAYIAYGPALRYQYFWSSQIESNVAVGGTGGSGSVFGFGGFFHFRLLEWFYLGVEPELIYIPRYSNDPPPVKTPSNQPPKESPEKWTTVFFLGGGIHRDFDFVHLNAGFMFDVADALRRPPSNLKPSPLADKYFIRTQTETGQPAWYLPIVPRITFFFPLGR